MGETFPPFLSLIFLGGGGDCLTVKFGGPGGHSVVLGYPAVAGVLAELQTSLLAVQACTSTPGLLPLNCNLQDVDDVHPLMAYSEMKTFLISI